MKVVRLSALSTGRLYLQEIFLVLISVSLSQPQGHSAAGRIMSMKNSNETVRNRTRDIPVCSAVPQPTAPPLASLIHEYFAKFCPGNSKRGTSHENQYTFLIISHSVLLRMKNISDKFCRENQNRHFRSNNRFFLFFFFF